MRRPNPTAKKRQRLATLTELQKRILQALADRSLTAPELAVELDVSEKEINSALRELSE